MNFLCGNLHAYKLEANYRLIDEPIQTNAKQDTIFKSTQKTRYVQNNTDDNDKKAKTQTEET